MTDVGIRMPADFATTPQSPFAADGRLGCAWSSSTFGLSPIRGSEAAIAWQHVSRLAKYHDIVALSFPGLRGEIREECAKYFASHGEVPGLTIEFIEPPPFARMLERNSSSLLRAFISVGNRSWQRAAFERARELHQQDPFDAAHQMTITGYASRVLMATGRAVFLGTCRGGFGCPVQLFSADGVARSNRVWRPQYRELGTDADRSPSAEGGADRQRDLGRGPRQYQSHHRHVGHSIDPHLRMRRLAAQAGSTHQKFQPGEKLRLVTAGYLSAERQSGRLTRARARGR